MILNRLNLVLISLSLVVAAGAASRKQALPELPESDDPEIQAIVKRYAADYTEASAPGFFNKPAGIAWPCEVSQEDQYRWFGLRFAIPGEWEQIQKGNKKLLRSVGINPNATKPPEYSDIKIIPLAASAKDGRLDGDVEVWVSYRTFERNEVPMATDGERQTMTMITRNKSISRGVYRFTNGEPNATGALVLRSLMDISMETTYSDPQMQKMMASVPTPKTEPSITVFYFSGIEPIERATFSTMPAVEIRGRVKTPAKTMAIFQRKITDDESVSYTYMGRRLQSRTPMRDGKPHGESVTYLDDVTQGGKFPLNRMPGFEDAKIVVIKGERLVEKITYFENGVPVLKASQ